MSIRFLPSVALLASLAAGVSAQAETRWPQWRGPAQVGVAPDGKYPVAWKAEGDKQVQWTTEIAGRGGSTPVVWDKLAFLTSGDGSDNLLWAIDVDSGKVAWKTSLGKDTGGKHAKGSGSNPSVVTDGNLVYAYYRSGDLAAVNFKGEKQWQVKVPEELKIAFDNETLWWDLGTSPVLTQDAVVVAIMHSGPSYVAGFDRKTGKLLWKADRSLDAPKEAAQSYSTPIVTKFNGEEIILVLGADHLTCHQAKDGKELWRVGGFNPRGEQFFRSIASPVLCGDLVICPYSRGNTLTAVRLKDHSIAWERDDLGADVPTPASLDGKVYLCTDKGRFVCLDGATGKTIGEAELPKSRKAFSSSPLIAGNHVYLTREDGAVLVVGLESPHKLVAENAVVEPATPLVASPVPVANGLLIRSGNQLLRVGSL